MLVQEILSRCLQATAEGATSAQGFQLCTRTAIRIVCLLASTACTYSAKPGKSSGLQHTAFMKHACQSAVFAPGFVHILPAAQKKQRPCAMHEQVDSICLCQCSQQIPTTSLQIIPAQVSVHCLKRDCDWLQADLCALEAVRVCRAAGAAGVRRPREPLEKSRTHRMS